MQLGAMNNPMVDVIDEIELFSDLGFEFLDLTLEPQQSYSASVDARRIAKALHNAGMGVVGHTAWYLPIASPFPELRQIAIKELKRCLKVCRDIGARKMNLHPHHKVPLHNDEWIAAQNTDALAELVDAAERMGMKITLENMPHFSRVAQLKPMLDAVPRAELLLDIGHANLDASYNRSEELLANFGSRLGHVHVSDNNGGHDDQHLPLGVGRINWLRVVRALKNAGYDSTITIEVFSDDDDYLAMSRDKLRQLWESTSAGE